MLKYSSYVLILVSFALLIFSNCKNEEPEPVPARNIDDVKADFSAIDIDEGGQNLSLDFINGINWDFRVIAPAVVPGQSYPLIFDLHGASGGAVDAHIFTDCYVEPAFENMEVYIISPNGGIELWTSNKNQAMVINLLLMAVEFWQVDADKVVVTGYSNGGNGSWFFGETQPDLFSAAIPMASSYNTLNTDGNPRLMPIPMYVIHGENDDLFPVIDTQNWVDLTNSVGSNVSLVIADTLTHNEPCNYTPYLSDAVTWLVEEVW